VGFGKDSRKKFSSQVQEENREKERKVVGLVVRWKRDENKLEKTKTSAAFLLNNRVVTETRYKWVDACGVWVRPAAQLARPPARCPQLAAAEKLPARDGKKTLAQQVAGWGADRG
jgi:hypothetical protein